MKPTTEFLKAKKDKDLTSIVVQHRPSEGKPTLRLCFDRINKYNKELYRDYFECETEIIGTYTEASFCLMFVNANDSPVRTFLKNIRKNSDVKFKVRDWNGNQYTREAGLKTYELFGIINGEYYLLDSTVMKRNSASPINPI